MARVVALTLTNAPSFSATILTIVLLPTPEGPLIITSLPFVFVSCIVYRLNHRMHGSKIRILLFPVSFGVFSG
jgi:hypothetical protein